MEKQKVYIFFTYRVEKIGGTQMYTAGKAKYLESIGWKVFVFTPDLQKEKSAISSLIKYLQTGFGCRFLDTTPYRFQKSDQDRCLDFLLKRLNLPDVEQCDVIIESHEDRLAYWAELLAERLKARHFFVACNENYRTIPRIDKTYEDNLDFFYFKWKRNELIAGPVMTKKLFNGYKNVTEPLMNMPKKLMVEMRPIQDADFPQIDEISRLDWNICHVGRATKSYVPYLIKGVGELAMRHPDKKINFIMVGNTEKLTDLLEQTFKNLPNVKLTLLGDMVPIPRLLFSKVDVACAVSQTALFIADEGIMTISANAAVHEKTSGVVGYDTELVIYGEPRFSYVETFENVLLKRLYDNKKYTLPKLLPPECYYEKFWQVVDNASKTKEYYTERLSQDRLRNWFASFPFAAIARGTKIILAGATEIAEDYRKQVIHQRDCTVEISSNGVKNLNGEPYCQILATVDEHPENFDDSVVGFERLKQLDYDAIVLTAYTSDVDQMREKILEIVPQMADRIVCNLCFAVTYRMQYKELILFDD